MTRRKAKTVSLKSLTAPEEAHAGRAVHLVPRGDDPVDTEQLHVHLLRRKQTNHDHEIYNLVNMCC